jgi:DNA gyrase/topoisomerase IV subunit B
MVSALGEDGRRYSNDALVADADGNGMHIKVLAIAALMHIFQSLFTDERVLDAVLPITQVGSTPAYTFAQQRRISNESGCSEKESYFKGVASYGDKLLQQYLFGSRKKWRIITEQNENLVQHFMNPDSTVANKKKMKQMVKDGDEDVPAYERDSINEAAA